MTVYIEIVEVFNDITVFKNKTEDTLRKLHSEGFTTDVKFAMSADEAGYVTRNAMIIYTKN